MGEGQFQNCVVMITGAASGFGAEAAKRFSAEGARLALCDINEEALNHVADDLRAGGHDVIAAPVDVSCKAHVEAHVANIVETFGTLDIAINNAGIGHPMTPLTALSVETFDQVMAINARGVFLGMKYQLPIMIERGEGAILNVASAAGLVGAGHLCAYAASKHAVVGLTRAAADEVARKGVRVNALCPSFASTPLFDEMADAVGKRHGIERDDAYTQIASRVPMRRVAEVGEVVQAMLWACSPENSFMTGQTISIDGGLTAI